MNIVPAPRITSAQHHCGQRPPLLLPAFGSPSTLTAGTATDINHHSQHSNAYLIWSAFLAVSPPESVIGVLTYWACSWSWHINRSDFRARVDDWYCIKVDGVLLSRCCVTRDTGPQKLWTYWSGSSISTSSRLRCNDERDSIAVDPICMFMNIKYRRLLFQPPDVLSYAVLLGPAYANIAHSKSDQQFMSWEYPYWKFLVKLASIEFNCGAGPLISQNHHSPPLFLPVKLFVTFLHSIVRWLLHSGNRVRLGVRYIRCSDRDICRIRASYRAPSSSYPALFWLSLKTWTE